jgi:hypothetical protein
VSKRRTRPPRQRKESSHGSSSPPATSPSVAPLASIAAAEITSDPPRPPSELDELDAGWDELLA